MSISIGGFLDVTKFHGARWNPLRNNRTDLQADSADLKSLNNMTNSTGELKSMDFAILGERPTHDYCMPFYILVTLIMAQNTASLGTATFSLPSFLHL